MKIYILSLNASNGREISRFLTEKNVPNKYFYDYESLEVGSKSENIDGVKNYLDSIYDDFDAFIEFPVSFCFEYAYEKDPSSKFIYSNFNKSEWIDRIKSVFLKNTSSKTYLFEEFFCNHYIQTGKNKMSDLTDDELSQIYDKHLLSIDTFFKNNENYLKLENDDIEFFTKLQNFLNI